MYRIFLKNKVEFTCSGEDNIVEGAAKQDITLEYSCLRGRCSTCKVKVLSGQSAPIETEMALSGTDLDNGYILSCVRVPESDMVLDTEDLSAYQIPVKKTFPAKINSVTKYTEDLLKVQLRFPPSQKLRYLSGQYFDVIRGGVRRSYSIANALDESNKIELFIKKYPGGEMSNYWFNSCQNEDLIRIEGPKGTFFLRDQKVKNIIFLATGTGIAPVKSILEEMSKTFEVGESEIYLFWGNRYNRDFFWNPKEINIPVKFFPVLSREKAAMVNTGYVQDILLKQDLDFSKSSVYACGSEQMIEEAKAKLTKKGLPDQNFFSDAFVISN